MNNLLQSGLIPAGNNAPTAFDVASNAFAPAADELWAVLQRQAAFYTGTDSTSVPAETAQELLRSVLFCAKAAQQTPGDLPPKATLAQQLLWGQRALLQKTEAAKRTLQKVKQTAPARPSIAYRDTLGALADFFVWYDIRLFAHDIPCMIDYPLCLPVPDTLLGVEYIEAYLAQLLCENRVCLCFPAAATSALLSALFPEWKQLHINLFEPVFYNALGLAPRLAQADGEGMAKIFCAF